MKDGIHPQYGPVTIQCACGNVMETRSSLKGTIQVDICSACHPFFTGKQKLIDTAGRIDRFKKKFGDKVVSSVVQKRTPPPAPKAKEKKEKLEAKLDQKTEQPEAPQNKAK